MLISGDKDFGGLIHFGRLWKKGKVIILRYCIIDIQQITQGIINTIENENESLLKRRSLIIVLSERGYRINIFN